MHSSIDDAAATEVEEEEHDVRRRRRSTEKMMMSTRGAMVMVIKSWRMEDGRRAGEFNFREVPAKTSSRI